MMSSLMGYHWGHESLGSAERTFSPLSTSENCGGIQDSDIQAGKYSLERLNIPPVLDMASTSPWLEVWILSKESGLNNMSISK